MNSGRFNEESLRTFIGNFKKHNKVDFKYTIERSPLGVNFHLLDDAGKAIETIDLHHPEHMNNICRLLERIVPKEVVEEGKVFERLLKYFKYDHLPEHLQIISKPFSDLAHKMAKQGFNDIGETMAGLRKLLEAKDCAVRAQIK